MARIFQFPKKLQEKAGHASDAPFEGVRQPWREVWRNPLIQALYRLFVAFIACSWLVLRWVVAADLFIQLLRILCIGGLPIFTALMHFLIVGIAAYMVACVPPLPPR